MILSRCSDMFTTPARHAVILLLVASASACVRPAGVGEVGRPASGASENRPTGCDASTKPAARLGRAVLSFTGASTGEATVRLEGEAYKSTVLVDVATGTVLELLEGTYQLRVSLAGYRAIDRSIAVVCGKDAPVAVRLNPR